MTDPRIINLARILVNYSTKVKRGDKVIIWGFPLEPVAAPLIRELYREVLHAGGHPHVIMNLPEINRLFYTEANEDQLRYVSPIATMIFEEFDVDIRIGANTNTRSLSNVDPKRQQMYAQNRSTLTETFMNRSAAGEYRWVATRYPTKAYAQDAEMSLQEFEDYLFSCTYADTDDPVAKWQEVYKWQARIADWLTGKDEIKLQGPNIDMTMSVKGRKFENDAGECNMPDGEIETGPVEDSVNGWVRYTYPAIYRSREVHDVELHFKDGKVVKATAAKGEEFLHAMLETDPGARYLGEFAIGTNYQVDRITKDMLFDEKMGGTIHMALGAGYPETGSKNKSAIHWDMLCDMRDGGKIFADGELFYESGKFVI
jgi:aminopeptidase